jgi:hypothetical protein
MITVEDALRDYICHVFKKLSKASLMQRSGRNLAELTCKGRCNFQILYIRSFIQSHHHYV